MVRKVERARALRRDPSRAEKICWDLLRAHRMAELKFRRQHPIGRYFADFACVARKLVIEIDGNFHADQVDGDLSRTAVMETLGWRVLRFGANEIVQNREGVWAAIDVALQEPAKPPSPRLSP